MDSLTSAFEAGATDYLIKPIDRSEVVARVRNAIPNKNPVQVPWSKLAAIISGAWMIAAAGLIYFF
jgi:DNA-binding response OmpR family regulator